MHFKALTACAFAGSGVTREESLALDRVSPTLYERLGHDTIVAISRGFYNRLSIVNSEFREPRSR